ncbi:phosphatidylserine decarboxylase [Annulohypoxylon maeteangense]|uniref:phosphatidylserine decarboxylase n=1 Tax=Annulohypoxylon maeteangense TaxID=1927788 RepID=UPI002007A7F6|nr:phosphatidylserine decarboxylase [Annulohypoxylon maeteangense]KAI0881111.1 phosphatidylserine decarboxylase [Annulohypoxylon maeteangense]
MSMSSLSSATIRGYSPISKRPLSSCMLRQTYTAVTPRLTRQFVATPKRCFHRSSHKYQQNERFSSRLRTALRDTKVTWYHIPVGLGIGFLGLVQFYKTQAREKERIEREAAGEDGTRPKKRARIRPDGPWQVQVMSTLPLKAMSRLWGKFNELTIPYYLRVPGFKLYAFIFGANLNEVSEPDLHVYPNLASFFYRTLKPGARPLDTNPDALLSPSDGRVLQFGKIEGNDIEQVKGMTYTIDALLGKHTPPPSLSGEKPETTDQATTPKPKHGDEELVSSDEEFARVNGISYTLPNLLSGPDDGHETKRLDDQTTTPSSPGAVSEVRADLALGEKPWYALLSPDNRTALYYAVVYLAPGDYHRFHSPANWVVERRRHFAGELYSVSPYLQRTLPGLFTLNERVVLLGRWRWGFFSFVPVGATNVGSITVNFDRELRTNSLLTDTAADRAAEEAAARGEPYSGFSEATYGAASRVLGGHALRRGDEMGGFKLGSTIVLVFEAPVADHPGAKGGFAWAVEKGQKVKMGQALGYVRE